MDGMRKPLPSRPSQDLGYSPPSSLPASQFGRQNEDEDRPPTSNGRNPPVNQSPNAAVILDGYRNEILSGVEGKPLYNPMNPSHPQSSMLLNVSDPIQVHLLVETALGDSKAFEILSQEEVDDLKKEIQSLSQRVEQTRQNLEIQSKYRDAAISMSKLNSPSHDPMSSDGSDKKLRKSLLAHKSTNSMQEAEAERLASERKCEDLAAELWSLEKRLIEPQNRLLKHTAGILQMTHKGPKKITKGPNGVQQDGIPGSPESMYTYSNARSIMEPIDDEMIFDERSLYLAAGAFGDFGESDSFGGPSPSQTREHMQMIATTEKKLEDLNSRLREVIIKVDPEREAEFSLPPLARTNSDGQPTESGQTLQSQLDYLEKNIATIDQEQSQSLRKQQEFQEQMEETIEGLNREVHGLLLPYNETHPEPPHLTGDSMQQQLMYFQDSIGAMEMELARAGTRNTGMKDNTEQMETVLMGLWDIIQSGEEEIRKRAQERRMARSAQGLADDEDDMSPDEGGDPNEPFTLQAFSAKVQWLYSQATRLKDQKKVLQRQIKQQRELNSKSDATKDAELTQTIEDLKSTKNLLARTEMDADAVREQLSLVMKKLDEARQQERLRDQSLANNESAAARTAQEDVEKRDATISALEDQLQELKDNHLISNAEIQGRISDSEAKIANLMAELAAAATAQASQQAVVEEKERELEDKEKEIEEMNMKLAELQTEVTIARAELDGAYGTRAQRAAEVAANPVIQKEIDDLMMKNTSLVTEIAQLKEQEKASLQGFEQMRMLKKELEETIGEYELMTKASIEWEKERESLEGTIDKLRDERESLEAQLSDEKVRWLGMKTPGVEGGPAVGSTSTTVLKNEFKKMMRDTRAEHQRALRSEQAERRRVEEELRTLKRLHGPGKSSLSQSIGSS